MYILLTRSFFFFFFVFIFSSIKRTQYHLHLVLPPKTKSVETSSHPEKKKHCVRCFNNNLEQSLLKFTMQVSIGIFTLAKRTVQSLFPLLLYHSLLWLLLLLWSFVSFLLLIFPLLLLLLLLLAPPTEQLRINRHIPPFDQFQIFPLDGFVCRSMWYSPAAAASGGAGAGSA